MTKKELINALANVSDDTPIVFGVYQSNTINAMCAIPDMVIYSDYYEEVIITNRVCNNREWTNNEHSILYKDYEYYESNNNPRTEKR